MKAILLAAGRGRRLGIEGPKCLVKIAGRSLLDRHLSNMAAAGVTSVVIVTGYGRELLTAELARLAPSIEVTTVFNELFVHGSIVSLARAVERITPAGGLWMDADVLYPSALLARLVSSKHDNSLLLDGRSSEQGEEMMLAVKDERVRRIGRRVGDDWDLVGESVGFFKVGASGAKVLQRVLEQEITHKRYDQEHEDALDRAFEDTAFGYERVDDLPWTEIDFPDDVVRANALASSIDHNPAYV